MPTLPKQLEHPDINMLPIYQICLVNTELIVVHRCVSNDIGGLLNAQLTGDITCEKNQQLIM